jgi:hypothetical protein
MLLLLLLLLLLLPAASSLPRCADIQRGMGAVQERNQTSGEVVLRAIACPANYYGVVGVTSGTDPVFKKYGKVATPCTQCPTNMITAGADGKVTSIKVPAADGQAATDKTVAATEGYYTVEACFTQPGYGECVVLVP